MGDDNRDKREDDLLLYISSREILAKAATRQSPYRIINRISERMKRKHKRHLNDDEWDEIYEMIRQYRKDHNLAVKTGRPKQREDQSMYAESEERYGRQQTIESRRQGSDT